MSYVFFVDRSLGKLVITGALRRAGAQVEVHDDHSPQNAPDELWLPEAGRRGWAVLTKDDRIRYRQVEMAAASTAGVALFIFTGKGMRGTAIADALVQALPAMAKLLETRQRSFVAKVSRRIDDMGEPAEGGPGEGICPLSSVESSYGLLNTSRLSCARGLQFFRASRQLGTLSCVWCPQN